MKKQLTTIFLVLVCFGSFAQVTFDKGYYINNGNQKVECLIKNLDWSDNPTSFQYKLSENSELKTITIKDVKEFSVYNSLKYLRATVKIDRSSDNTNDLDSNRNIKFAEEEIFLRTMVEGDATLYNYQEGNLTRFFFKKEASEIKQLIYKRYFVTATKVGKNNQYQQQLWNSLKCQKLSIKDIERLDYKASKLIPFFIKYNKCHDSGFVEIENNYKKESLSFSLRPGISLSSLDTKSRGTFFTRNFTSDNLTAYRFAIEGELVIGSNNGKWAVLFELAYESFKTKQEASIVSSIGGVVVPTTLRIIEIDYTSIEFPIGLRHYLFLNGNSKLFVNGVFSLSAGGNLSIDNFTELKKAHSFKFGVGYKYKDKYSLEFRYGANKNIGRNTDRGWSYQNNMLSIIFGYKIF
tara:strand:- start:4644 stop:5864 length:1221 start_codon:yes stop_codon:yes gene_type:complete